MSDSHTHTRAHTHTHTRPSQEALTVLQGSGERGGACRRGARRGRMQPALPSTLRSQGPPPSSVLLQASASLAVSWVTVRVNYTCVSIM